MGIRFLKRHSILAGAALLILAVAVTMLANGGNRGPEPAPFLDPVPSSSQGAASASSAGTASSSGAPSSQAEASAPSSSQPAAQAVQTTAEEEMRAVWVPYMSLDMSKDEDRGEEKFREKFSAIACGAKEYGMNALVVHVRPFGDALYRSQYAPWSHIVSGTQGVDPGYDPLEIMVEIAHGEGLELHAWMNPLRIQINGTPSILAENNPWNLWKDDPEKESWAVESGSGKYYNPAYPQVRSLIADCAAEIAANYDVDGIQFDDYFYPTQDEGFDKAAYEAYRTSALESGVPLSLQEWRIANINALVAQVYQQVKAANPQVQFGIAPQGNLQNDWNMGADVASWCKAKGFVDYICPQLYVNFENEALPFGPAAQTWKNLVKDPDIELYFGLAVYKAGSDADGGTWKNASDILARQVSLGRTVECDGFMFYSWDYLTAEQTQEEVANVMKVLNQE